MNKFIFISMLLIVFLSVGCSRNNATMAAVADLGNSASAPVNAIVKEIKIDAFQFGYSPDKITVKKGEKIKLIINNIDVPHGIRIPEYEIKGDESIEFVADKVGEFNWYCTNMCGPGHKFMTG